MSNIQKNYSKNQTVKNGTLNIIIVLGIMLLFSFVASLYAESQVNADFIKATINLPDKWLNKNIILHVKMKRYETSLEGNPTMSSNIDFQDKYIIKAWSMTNECCGLNFFLIIKKSKDNEDKIDSIIGTDNRKRIYGRIVGYSIDDFLSEKLPIVEVESLE